MRRSSPQADSLQSRCELHPVRLSHRTNGTLEAHLTAPVHALPGPCTEVTREVEKIEKTGALFVTVKNLHNLR